MDHLEHKKGMGFDLPKDYFEQLETNIELAEMEASLPETTGFNVPTGYFEAFDEVLFNKVQESSTVKVIPLYQRTWFRVTTSIAACLLIGFFIVNYNNGASSDSFDKLDIAAYEITDYFENNTTSLDTEDVASLLTDEELDEISLENDILNASNIEDYLLENLDDTSLLIE